MIRLSEVSPAPPLTVRDQKRGDSPRIPRPGSAVAYVEHIDPKVVLIDGRRLAQLMIDFEVGVSTARTYSVKRVDSDYFEEG